MKISIIVPCSRPDTVEETIQSLLRQEWKDFEVLVVGQGEKGDERTIAVRTVVENTANDSRVSYVHCRQRGAARARNAGIEAARGDLLAFIDDDSAANADWLSTLVSRFDQDPDIGVVGGAVIAPEKTGFGFARCPSVNPSESVYEPQRMGGVPPPGWDWLSCNFAMKPDIARKIGPFDQYLGAGSDFPAAEETDYILRAEALNIKMATTPRAIVVHTYGHRYNRQLVNLIKNYNYGNGGLAAKLTLMGDPRGQSWLEGNNNDRLAGWLWPPRPDKWLRRRFTWQQFSMAYERCIRNYCVENNLLRPLEGVAHE